MLAIGSGALMVQKETAAALSEAHHLGLASLRRMAATKGDVEGDTILQRRGA
jgi:hypothetical protein